MSTSAGYRTAPHNSGHNTNLSSGRNYDHNPGRNHGRNHGQDPGRIISYFLNEKRTLAVITATGIFYNIGMTAGPWFEGRLALARTLYHRRPVMILDDPFSAVDPATEQKIMANIRRMASDSIVIIISHRLSFFPRLDQVIWLGGGRARTADHQTLMRECDGYSELFRLQQEGGACHEK